MVGTATILINEKRFSVAELTLDAAAAQNSLADVVGRLGGDAAPRRDLPGAYRRPPRLGLGGATPSSGAWIEADTCTWSIMDRGSLS